MSTTALKEAIELVKDPWRPGEGDLNYIGLEHINENSLSLNGVGKSAALESNKFHFRKGDILFGKLRPYFRKVVMPDFDGVCSTDIWVMRARDGYDQHFLFYFMANPILVAQSSGASTGTKMPRADWGFLGNTTWYFPPLPEQRSIAAVLSSLDNKIELLRRQNETLEQIAQAIFNEKFVRNDLPEGRSVGVVNDFAEILSGFAFKSSDFDTKGKYGLITIKNVQSGFFVEKATDRLSALPAKMPSYCFLKTGDVLLSLTGNVGRVCYVVGDDYLLNQRVAKIKPRNEKDFAFTYIYFRQPLFLAKLEKVASGTAQQNLSPIKTGELEVVMPSRDALDAYAAVANPLILKMWGNSVQIQKLANIRDLLLPKLVGGEIRVSN